MNLELMKYAQQYQELYIKENRTEEDDNLIQELRKKLFGYIKIAKNPTMILLNILNTYGKLTGTIENPFFSDRQCINEILNEFRLIEDSVLDDPFI